MCINDKAASVVRATEYLARLIVYADVAVVSARVLRCVQGIYRLCGHSDHVNFSGENLMVQ